MIECSGELPFEVVEGSIEDFISACISNTDEATEETE